MKFHRCLALLAIVPTLAQAQSDWPSYGGDLGGMRYSPLTQITPRNVATLRPAWTYHMKTGVVAAATVVKDDDHLAPSETKTAPETFVSSNSTPLVADGLMYLVTPYNSVVALQPETGKLAWTFRVPDQGQPASRGLAYWPGDKSRAGRIFFGTREGRLIALDSKSGKLAAEFGNNGVINLRTAEFMRGFDTLQYGLNGPPMVFKDTIVVGIRVPEVQAAGGPSGAVRSFDARTGKPVWSYDAVPKAGQKGAATWQSGSTKDRTGVNVWGAMSADAKRGIIYLPFAAPSWDRYGGERKGDNLFSTTLVAVNGASGRYLWHFQVVHHDIWDFDLGAAPLLIDVKQGRRSIPAVTILSKTGLVFILNRVTGKPVYKVEERPVPASDVPGEQASPTQPFPVKPAPIARLTMAASDIADVSPEHKAFCEQKVATEKLRFGGPYLPTGLNTATVQFPGVLGGPNWGGGAADPALGLVFVNSQDLGEIMSLVPTPGEVAPYRNVRLGKYWDLKARLPCNPTPWGELVAIDVNRGEIAWRSTLGVTDSLAPGKQLTGRPNIGGPIATAGGLVFIGATDDSRFRAFESRTGKEVWSTKLDASAHAGPITYQGRDGKQYVVVVATGGGVLLTPTTSDAVVAYALP